MTSLSVTDSFSSLEEQGRELFYPLSLKHEDYYCFPKNLHTSWPKCSYYDSLISIFFSIMKTGYCGFNAESCSYFFEKCQGHKMKQKVLQKWLYHIADALFHSYFFKEMGWERSWKERRNGNVVGGWTLRRKLHLFLRKHPFYPSECILSSSFCLFLKLFKILSQSFIYIYLLPECFWFSVSWI